MEGLVLCAAGVWTELPTSSDEPAHLLQQHV